MPLTLEATYQDGVLKLDRPLPIKENERVQVTITTKPGQVKHVVIPWKGSHEELQYLAESPDLDLGEPS